MQKKNNKAWLYLLPTLILLVIFTFYPLVNTIIISFLESYEGVYGTSDGLGLRNFTLIGQAIPLIGGLFSAIDPSLPNVPDTFKYIFENTFIIAFVTVPISTILALLIAVGLNSIKVFQKIFQVIFFLPYVTNAIAIGLVFAVLFNDSNGLINAILDFVGLDTQSFIGIHSSRAMNLLVLSIYIIWGSLAFKVLLFSGGLQSIDKQYYQAAKIDGASRFKVLRKITVPLLSPIIFYVLITSFIGAFKEYSTIVGLFGDGANNGKVGTVVWFIYDRLATDGTGQAAAAAVILVIFIMFFTLINMRVSKKRVHY